MLKLFLIINAFASCREHSDLTEITEVWAKYRQAEADIETAEAMLSDPDFKEMAQEEIREPGPDRVT